MCGQDKTRQDTFLVTTANLKFKLHFNPILSGLQQREQVIEITLLYLALSRSRSLSFSLTRSLASVACVHVESFRLLAAAMQHFESISVLNKFQNP